MDLSRWRFLDTDMRNALLVGVTWRRFGRWGRGYRVGVYDETTALTEGQLLFAKVERLYRELKQNCELRRDYQRASDFHYGEKEMQRKSKDTRLSQRFFLTLYWLVSGYGERYLRPLVCALLLFLACTSGYLYLGLKTPTQSWVEPISLNGIATWEDFSKDWENVFATIGNASIYSLQVITFLRPQDYALSGVAKAIYTVQSLLGPLFFGLFALAVRQRLRR